MLSFRLPDTKKGHEQGFPFKLQHNRMSLNLTKRGFIKYVFVIVGVLVVYIVGALLVIDYFPH